MKKILGFFIGITIIPAGWAIVILDAPDIFNPDPGIGMVRVLCLILAGMGVALASLPE